MVKASKKIISVFLSALIVMFSAVVFPSFGSSEFLISADAKLTPDTPGITMDMLRDEMAAEYQAFLDKFTGPDYDLSYEAIPVTGDRMLESSPGIRAKTLEITADKATDEDKAYAIFDWIVNNIYYDYDHFYDSKNNPTFRPAATAFENKRTVCEGYSNLYSAMCREAGIPCRVVTGLVCFGTESLEGFKSIFFGPDHRKIVHAWNEVFFNNEWHLVDSTWGSSNMYQNGEFYKYENHTGNYFDMSMFAFGRSHMAVEYNTMLKLDDFLVKPLKGKVYAQKYIGNGASVKINDKIESLSYNIFGEATSVKELILPSGFDKVELSPPFFVPYVEKLVFSEGIKKITPVLFENAGNVEEIILPSSLEEIGSYAFSGCTALRNVVIPSSVKKIGENAFNYCSPATVNFDGTKEQWQSVDIGQNNEGLLNADIIFKNDTHIHSYTGTVTKEATCKETGIITYTCSCGDSYTEIIPKTNKHTPGEWITDKAPTCKETGSRHQICSVCGETTATEILNKTEHKTEIIPAIAPTCTKAGATEGIKCSVCGEIIVAPEKVDIILHEDKDKDGKCDMCGENMAEEKPVCNHMCHSTNPLMQFLWKIINFFNKIFKINQYCSCGAKHW